jgi:hypothetical protein
MVSTSSLRRAGCASFIEDVCVRVRRLDDKARREALYTAAYETDR